MRTHLWSCLVLWTLLAGCDSAPPQPAQSNAAKSTDSPLVIVVGDETAEEVVRRLDTASVRTSTDLTDQAEAALVIVAQDATQGASAVHKELVAQLRSRDAEHFLWLMTRSSQIEDQELLELEELEARELLNEHGLPGDGIPFAFDSEDAPVDPSYGCLKGWDDVNRHVASFQEPE